MTEGVEEIIKTIRGLQSLSDWKEEQEGRIGLVQGANKLAEKLGKGQDTAVDTHVRKFLDALRKLDIAFSRQKEEKAKEEKAFDRSRVALLKPKLAYAVSRKEELLPLYQILEVAIPKIKNRKDFKYLVDFVESVVAFYKYRELGLKG